MKDIFKSLIRQVLIFFVMFVMTLPFIYMIASANYIMIHFTRPFLAFPNYIVTSFYDDEIPGNDKYHVAMYNMKSDNEYELVYMSSFPDHRAVCEGHWVALDLSYKMYPHFEAYLQNPTPEPLWHAQVLPTCYMPRMTPLVKAAEIIARRVMQSRAEIAVEATTIEPPRQRVLPPVPRFDHQIPVYEPPSQQAMQEANRAIFPPDYSEFPAPEDM